MSDWLTDCPASPPLTEAPRVQPPSKRSPVQCESLSSDLCRLRRATLVAACCGSELLPMLVVLQMCMLGVSSAGVSMSWKVSSRAMKRLQARCCVSHSLECGRVVVRSVCEDSVQSAADGGKHSGRLVADCRAGREQLSVAQQRSRTTSACGSCKPWRCTAHNTAQHNTTQHADASHSEQSANQ